MLFHSVFGPCGIQVVEMVRIQGFVVCTVAVSLCRPPCYPVQDRSLDGAGPLPAWHQPCMNEIILPAGAVLRHHTVCHAASTVSGSETLTLATLRAEKKRRIESARMHGSTRRSGYPSDSSRRRRSKHLVGLTASSTPATCRPHRPGPGTGHATPPGRWHLLVTRTGALAPPATENPPPSSARARGSAMPPRPDGADSR